MRPTRDEWGLQLAKLVATRSTCLRRAVGCVLLDARGRVLATGYNGVPAGARHCNEPAVTEAWLGLVPIPYPYACPGAHAPSGTGLEGCEAIHAEQNALLQCRDPDAIHTCYTTVSPCDTCIKLLLGTDCRRLVFTEMYPHSGAIERWRRAGREYEFYANLG